MHGGSISAIADIASAFHRGRASAADVRQLSPMSDEWRHRIEAAATRDKRSLREISLAAGLSHGYLHGILRDGKEPTLDRFVKICRELNLSVAYALLGVDLSPETVEIVQALEGDPQSRSAMLTILRKPSKS